MNPPFRPEEPYSVGFYVIDRILARDRTPFVIVVDPLKCMDAKAARETFSIPSDKQLFIFSGAPSDPLSGESVLCPLFNIDLFKLTPSGVVYDQNGVLIEDINEVREIRKPASAIDAAKILCLSDRYPDLIGRPISDLGKIKALLRDAKEIDATNHQYATEMFEIIDS